jgi:hypothetical protein
LLIASGFGFRVLEIGQRWAWQDYICPLSWLWRVDLLGRRLGGWRSQLEFWGNCCC